MTQFHVKTHKKNKLIRSKVEENKDNTPQWKTSTNLKIKRLASSDYASVLINREAAFLIASGDVKNERRAAQGSNCGYVCSTITVLHYLWKKGQQRSILNVYISLLCPCI